MSEQTALHTLLLDSLDDQIAVIDREGNIVYVNRAWKIFGIENGLAAASCGKGSNYLKVCSAAGSSGDSLAGEAEQGLRDVLNGKRASFYFEYPCHSPMEKRWFMMRATPLQGDTENLFVISHHNITQRKQAEEQVKYLSLHDPLTGLANRRHFDQFLSNEWRRSTRSRSPISFIMFDLDNFKDYNDDLGHLAGDQCLVKIGQMLRAYSGRSSDLAVRYGGEEFGLLLGETNLEESAKVAEAIRKAIYDSNISYRGTKRMTISAGVASDIPGNDHAVESLILAADKALYSAKLMGRDRIVLAMDAITK